MFNCYYDKKKHLNGGHATSKHIFFILCKISKQYKQKMHPLSLSITAWLLWSTLSDMVRGNQWQDIRGNEVSHCCHQASSVTASGFIVTCLDLGLFLWVKNVTAATWKIGNHRLNTQAADVPNWIFGCLTADSFVKMYETKDRWSKKYMINFYDTFSVDQLIY